MFHAIDPLATTSVEPLAVINDPESVELELTNVYADVLEATPMYP